MNDNSNTHINAQGEMIKDISSKAEVPCPTCHGKGSIPDPQTIGKMMGYCGRNGERSPHVICRTCSGRGWVLKTI